VKSNLDYCGTALLSNGSQSLLEEMAEQRPPEVLSVSRLEACVGALMQSNFDADSQAFLTTLLRIADNLLSRPYDAKVRQLRCENPSVKNKLLGRRGGLEVLLACGFEEEAAPPPLLSRASDAVGEPLLVYRHEDTSFLRTARRLMVSRLVQELKVPADQIPPEPPRVVIPPPSDGPTAATAATSFNVYAGHRYDAASAALGVQVAPDAGHVGKTEAALRSLTQKQEQLERQLQREVADREWRATRPGEAAAPSAAAADSAEDRPSPAGAGKSDSGLLAARMQRQQQDRQRRDAGFTTRAMREVERLKKARVNSHTVLTLQFDDGCRLSGRFLPGETLRQVRQAVVDECLAQPVEFDLVVTPPRRVLGLSQTLHQEGLVPAAKVVVSWKVPQAQRGSRPGWYLKPEVFAASNDTISSSGGPAFPDSKPLVDPSAEGEDQTDAAPDAASSQKPPPTESREDALLRRMMGGGGGGGGGRKPGPSSSSGAPAGAPKPDEKKPRWFKG
jgi:hypothetical protein